MPIADRGAVERALAREHHADAAPARTLRRLAEHGREREPVPFGGSPGPLRLFGVGLGDQGGWILPFAFFGLLALALLLLLEPGSRRAARPRSRGPAEPARARDAARPDGSRRCSCSAAGSLAEAVVLSTSKGIVHPYYISALAPGAAAMAASARSRW